MAYDLEEQEQLASFKAWWNQYGNLFTWLLILVLTAYSGWTGWNYYQRTQSVQASQLYDELQKALIAKDDSKVQRAASDMEARFGRTAYAQMGALTAAKSAFEAGDMNVAKGQLEWAVTHGNAEYKAIAKLRLSGLLLDEKSYDAALAALSGATLSQFAGNVADRKGDILVAQNKLLEARVAYQEALDATDKKNPGYQLIQLKLEATGAPALTAATAAP
ncbi:MAG: putative negative regulator of RcsB-dependent stress response [Janthinobacterium sp.]|jgi:predicted negative regulator of RcsB-dependent stress response